MVSRLDRLFILLDTGSNESVRLAAAKQLGEVQRVQPHDLSYLLERIKEYSGKTLWETRVAAGNAIRCVLEQVDPWPSSQKLGNLIDQDDDKGSCKRTIAKQLIEQTVDFQKLILDFDLERIMSSCPKLLSLHEADEVELVSPSCSKSSKSRGRGRKESTSRLSTSKNDKEQLMRQRKLINKELGIMDSLNLGVKSTDIVSNDDLQLEYETSEMTIADNKTSSKQQQDLHNILKEQISNYAKILDLLRKSNCLFNDEPPKIKDDTQSATESPEIATRLYNWPLTCIAKQYTDDLFNPSWEIRHGAAIALREIVKLQGTSAGKRLEFTDQVNESLNQLWLIDMALRAVSVLALDRFGDFLFDQVVAPVRENAAQLLGCCVANMTETNVYSTIQLILRMLTNPNWETRHGGVLGLKYSLSVVNQSFSKMILKDCFDSIFNCLADQVDDVSAEAAAALVPVKDLMLEVIPDKAPKLIKFLWDHLANLDELTTSTSNIVLLLASLVTSSSTHLEPEELKKSIPRLWTLLSHSSTSVRVSVLKAIKTLFDAQKSTCLTWMSDELMTTMLRLIFQRAILENMEEVREYIEKVWLHLIRVDKESQTDRFNLLKSSSQYLNYWLCLVMQPSNTPIDRSSTMWLNIGSDGSISSTKPEGEVYIASYTFNAETMNQQKIQVTKCRLLGTKLLGALYANLINDFDETPESQHAKETLKYLTDMFSYYIKTKSANQRMISGWTLESWAYEQAQLLNYDEKKLKGILPRPLVDQLSSATQEVSLCYDELASTFTRLQQETRDFVAALQNAKIPLNLPPNTDKRALFNLSQIQMLCDLNLEVELNTLASKRSQSSANSSENDHTRSKILTTLSEKKLNLTKSFRQTTHSQKSLSASVLSSLACAHISWRLIPSKLDVIIDPILDSIELEEEQTLQDKSVSYIVILIDILSKDLAKYKTLLNDILNRLISILSCQALSNNIDPLLTSLSSLPNSPRSSIDATRGASDNYRIVLLDNLQRKAELSRSSTRRQSTITNASSLKRSYSLTLENEQESTMTQDEITRSQHSKELSEVKMRGASKTLRKVAEHFQDDLPKKLPELWWLITDFIKSQINSDRTESVVIDETKLIRSLRLLEIVGESLNENLRIHLLELFDDLIILLSNSNPTIRHHSAQCIGVISKLMFSRTIDKIGRKIISMLDRTDNTFVRCGAIEAIALIIEHLHLGLVPRINMFIIHVLKRMSDQNDQVRLMATHCFGKLLSLMPLNLDRNKKSSDTDEKVNLSEVQDDQNFIEQLLNPKKLENFVIPFTMKTELRSYQQEGLNWLAFLNRFNLHGILCDEMGLGKTFMTVCMIVSDHLTQERLSREDPSLHSKSLPSLVVCPSTLTEHWLYEIEKFLPPDVRSFMNPFAYSGTLTERTNIKTKILSATNNSKENQQSNINLVIASYDIVRNDIEFFKEVSWNYCVLDEGHIIKNGKTKLSRAIRLLYTKHRLILSGTPIQNNVTELWSLFDFLMPGFLGSDRQFNSKYAKPILQSRELKCSARELEAGALAMESLHRQVLPFILRRIKEDVLDDLPPKIIQDYYCELSPLQHRLYEDFTRSRLCKDVTKQSIHKLNEDNSETDCVAKSDSKSHVFQALQYLKNVCNHPKLVLTANHAQYSEIKKDLDKEKSSLDDISHSSKLKALKQLLIDCGIGIQLIEDQQQQQQALDLQSVVNQHRALIFCQIRSMVDIIENDLLKKHLPSITYLKLDGSVPANQRHSVVSRFNNDPSIDILLLTTQIGGLGLNLTGADTVIFVEHDWNPTKDLQAMDRAHRIGQKKVVNVYRLITKGTLEEKIMGLQKFKTMVSNTVINQDNAGIGTMNVDQLFDLFEENVSEKGGDSSRKSKSSSFIDLLPELWDQQQYETEYDLSNFVSSLKN